ncbi:Hpt domain-containing protein [Puniceibacterium sp. IMCC21224]|uniref:Hpt domain-containing protein n=1 Tax=Puniceibacterium sp. IMCC21224 TaxID=1618204 RepID=UPI00064DCE8F|nr:Hpt domain-containing protein [Puniceibacterium sp. IMCC21224]KMK65429.1 Hpt domain-containing protein [Puniceibacterium sp. IMCC21224]
MIDWSRVRELCDEIGADDFGEVVELFLAEVEETLDSLPTRMSDANALENALHFLKGSALNLGFSALAQHCQAAERAAAGGDVVGIDPGHVLSIYNMSRKLFLTELPKHMAA